MDLLRGADRTLVIGHRGAAAVAPENTLEALEAAVAAGADAVEFDVGAGLVLSHSEHERPEQAVGLDEALDFLASRELGIEIDLKLVGIESEVAAAVRRHGLVERTFVASTWTRSLRRLAELAPELRRAVSCPRDRLGAGGRSWPRPVSAGGAAAWRAVMPLQARLLIPYARANALSLHHALVSPAVVRAAHVRGVAVLAWTVNEPAQIERVAKAGVDAVVSDDPGKARDVLATLNLP